MNGRLVHFLYVLLRDKVHPGVVERIVQDTEQTRGACNYSNEHLEGYAHEIADRLLHIQKRVYGRRDAARARAAVHCFMRDTNLGSREIRERLDSLVDQWNP